jgi:hypothetical protein
VNEVRDALAKHSVALALVFTFFANESGGFKSGNVHSMSLEHFRMFVAATSIIDPRGKACRSMNKLDSVFVVRCFARTPYTRVPSLLVIVCNAGA